MSPSSQGAENSTTRALQIVYIEEILTIWKNAHTSHVIALITSKKESHYYTKTQPRISKLNQYARWKKNETMQQEELKNCNIHVCSSWVKILFFC